MWRRRADRGSARRSDPWRAGDAASRAGRPRLELVREVPGPHVPWLEPDERGVGRAVAVRIGRAAALAEVADRDAAHPVAGVLEACFGAQLDATIRRDVLVDDDARARVAAKVQHLHVAASADDVEAA